MGGDQMANIFLLACMELKSTPPAWAGTHSFLQYLR